MGTARPGRGSGAGLLRRLGATGAGVWAIKRIVAPLDRALYRLTGGRVSLSGRLFGPIVLLTTTGRRTGRDHTTPVFCLREGARLVICNVTPQGARPSPWVRNLRARPLARVQVGPLTRAYRAREATAGEVARYWPRLLGVWPAYGTHHARGGARSIFVLEPHPH